MTGSREFSVALAAVFIAASSADIVPAAEGVGSLVPIDRTLVFGFVAPGVSAPIVRVFKGGGPEVGAGFGADAATADFGSEADGLLAMMGICCC